MIRAMVRFLLTASILARASPLPLRADTRTLTLRYGPVAMAGFNVEFPKLWVPPRRSTATWWDGRAAGRHARAAVTIRDVMLHHVVFYKRVAPKSQSACASTQEAFYGTGEEKEQLRLPEGYGYPVGKAERWKMNAMLMSHSLRSLKVRVEYTVTIETGASSSP